MTENSKNEPINVTPVREPGGMAAFFSPNLAPQPRPFHEPPAPALSLGDIYYTVFRHKWLIAVCSMAGIATAVLFYRLNPPTYVSRAKLFVRYVLDAQPLTLVEDEGQKRLPESGENIINSEIEILTSRDLADQVASVVGADKLLGKLGGSNDVVRAAGVVQGGLQVQAPQKSSVIRIAFEHQDPAVTQPVLRQLITAYIAKHLEVHRGVGMFDDYLAKQRDKLRSDLAEAENELRQLKQQLGLVSLEETRKTYDQHLGKLRQEVFDVEAQLAERRTMLKQLGTVLPEPANTNTAPAQVIPADKIEQHKRLASRLETLAKREDELLLQYTPEAPRVKNVREQLAEVERQKDQLEADYPGLKSVPSLASVSMPRSTSPTIDTITEAARIAGLETRLQALTNQLAKVQAEVQRIDQTESRMVELQRRRDLLEKQYLAYSTGLERTLINETFASGKIPNINVVQEPTPPARAISKLAGPMAGMLAGGIGLGLALAFFTERVLRQSVRLPSDLEKRLRVPVFLAIPQTDQGRHRSRALLSNDGKPKPALDDGTLSASQASPATDGGSTEIVPWDARHPLRAYYEALRDRLITYFEVRNMTHRPKLVALSSCHRKAGVSSIASGLAATMSETGDGKVLLVDMNLEHGGASFFMDGRPDCSLAEALQETKRETALVSQNLYLVGEANREGNGRSDLPKALPKRFMQLVPKLKASDYDYIIFDMPPVDQTSITPRLASYMDMLLLVVEPEKTNREAARLAMAMLHESRANVAAIVNKQKSYIPAWLYHEW
jgi:uncharacterized protein involved in exopolysaccharide biosynthesis/Mrp family chromosome partitioning ATPase